MKAGIKSPDQMSARRGTIVFLNALAAAAFSTVAIGRAGVHPGRDPIFALLWAVWMAVPLIWVFGIPGYLRWSKIERSIVNDERVRAHQAAAARVGLGVAIASLAILSSAAFTGTVFPAWAAPALATGTVVVTALVFAWLERRDG
ncbi:hypothetical protein KZ810_04365 [Sphingomonas sp. RHCKR47]|uniref:hypothetical protein n=1 Tax=Sphingomonas citricola TaxID=2862498 RepID=UPI001CA58C1B|nr:hypothetical protein [Sphingomonas citricola]MBW6522724.1 hypothetical protein [Sphingomonas citricola]